MGGEALTTEFAADDDDEDESASVSESLKSRSTGSPRGGFRGGRGRPLSIE